MAPFATRAYLQCWTSHYEGAEGYMPAATFEYLWGTHGQWRKPGPFYARALWRMV